ncbi:glycosyltransferase [Candidatus Kaiserbacteria bacterium]|nr:glycosyltransferase [Candidatus Kaiserbacteria bacterium]
MKVCWFGCYDSDYARNQILLHGLRLNGVDVIECNETSIGWRRYPRLIKKLHELKNQYDIIYCAFPAGYFVTIAWLFQKKPIVVDAFFPMHDAYVHDRKVVSKWSLYALWLSVVDRLTVSLADRVIVDTKQHALYWKRIVPKQHYELIPVGAETRIYHQIDLADKHEGIIVTFHGTYIPLQGVPNLIEVTKLLKSDDKIKFRFIGPKALHAAIVEQLGSNPKNIELLPWLSQTELNQRLNESDIILGIFGQSEKAKRVIPNKVFQGIAVKKPIITMDSPAIREVFSEKDVMLVGNKSEEIAAAIKELSHNSELCAKLANSAYEKLQKVGLPEMLGQRLKEVFSRLSSV